MFTNNYDERGPPMNSSIINTYRSSDRKVTVHHGDVSSIASTLPSNTFDGILYPCLDAQLDAPSIHFWDELRRLSKISTLLLVFGESSQKHRIVCNIEDAGWEIHTAGTGSALLATKHLETLPWQGYLLSRIRTLGVCGSLQELSQEAEARLCEFAARTLLPDETRSVQRLLIPTSGETQIIQAGLRAGWSHIVGVEADTSSVNGTKKHLPTFQSSSHVKSPLSLNCISNGKCRDLIPQLPDDSVDVVVTSPPYADQRKKHYPGIPAEEYPTFTVDWMDRVILKLKAHGSVLIVIRPDLKKGAINDYVLRTRLALRDAGWHECEELIWLKRDGGACMGSKYRPRRCYEHILWFSRTHDPFVDMKACGHWADDLSFRATSSGRHWKNKRGAGQTKLTDVIDVPVRRNPRGIDHPAMFSPELAETLIKSFCPEGGVALDPFAGSGNTCLAARNCGRDFYGFDIMAKYCELARKRLDDQDPTVSLAG